MEKLIGGIADFMVGQLNDFEGLKEFGLTAEDGSAIVAKIREHLETWLTKAAPAPENVTLTVGDEVYHGVIAATKKIESLRREGPMEKLLFEDGSAEEEADFSEDQYDCIWERHGWAHVHEFIDDIPDMESGWEYCFLFHLNKESYNEDVAYPLFMLGAVILKKGDDPVSMSCSVEKSEDHQNHFKLLRRK